MMSFCKTFLGFSDSRHYPPPPPSSSGLRLIAAGDLHTPPYVLTSPAVKPAVKLPDEADLHLRHLVSYDVDGLRSCTEGLGFESSDERGSTDGEEEILQIRSQSRKKSRERRSAEDRTQFPPPMPSLNRKGERSFFLRPEKKDGRLLLTEVKKIERQEILRAFRQDGRLRLELIPKPEEEKEKESGEDLTVHLWPLPLRLTCHHQECPSYWGQRCVMTT